MADRVLEFLNNLLKIGKEQFFLKSTFLRNKVPIKPVLGLTGLGVLFMAVRPFLSNGDDSADDEIESAIGSKEKPEEEEEEGKEKYTIKKTLYLMKEKEKLLRKQEQASQERS